ncbi:MAG: GNAT family N-acetyltransferase, partial [Chthoniobacteraceae bacterium]|nr:GNAT family N-acetyltransferase [Chthoniobacteraceae bacterium]
RKDGRTGSEAMGCQPTLNTKRLILRPFAPEDAPDLLRLVNAPEIAATTVRIPHPYPAPLATSWIRQQPRIFDAGEGATFAIVRRRAATLVGCVGLGCDLDNRSAELGYWIGTPYWNRGYATEAARMVVAFGFAYFGLHRIKSCTFGSNPASGRVLEKIGMRREGFRRDHLYKEGRGFEDVVEYGILATDFTRQVMEGNK